MANLLYIHGKNSMASHNSDVLFQQCTVDSIITPHTRSICQEGEREDWGGLFSSPILPRDMEGGVGSHHVLGGEEGTEKACWEGGGHSELGEREGEYMALEGVSAHSELGKGEGLG